MSHDAGPPLPPDVQVRLSHAGEWIAWDRDFTWAVAAGTDFEVVRAEAVAAGAERPVMEWVPPVPVYPFDVTGRHR